MDPIWWPVYIVYFMLRNYDFQWKNKSLKWLMVVSELRGLLVSGGCFQNDSDVTEGACIYDCSQLALPSCRPVVLGKENVSVTELLPSLGRAVARLLPWCDCNVSASLLDLQFQSRSVAWRTGDCKHHQAGQRGTWASPGQQSCDLLLPWCKKHWVALGSF